jgi:hypothetical protein
MPPQPREFSRQPGEPISGVRRVRRLARAVQRIEQTDDLRWVDLGNSLLQGGEH